MKKRFSITKTVVAIIIFQSFLLTMVCLLVAGAFFKVSATEIYEEMSKSITSIAISSVDRSEVVKMCDLTNEAFRSFGKDSLPTDANIDGYADRFAEIEKREDYKRLQHNLNKARHNTGSTALCLVLMYPRENVGVYVIDASDGNIVPCGTIFNKDLSSLIDSYGHQFGGFISLSSKYGYVRTDGIPVYVNDATGCYAYLTADIPISRVSARARDFLIRTALIAVIITSVICTVAVVFIKRMVIKPINAIAGTAEEFVSDYEKRFDSQTETHIFERVDGGKVEEFHELACSLQSMELEMNSYVNSLSILTEENARISVELGLASSIQESMLPRKFPAFPDRKDFDIYASMKPAKEVGGDFYDFFLVDDDHIALVIADVSGKGVPAALFMAIAKTLIMNRLMGGDTPAEALNNVNEHINANNDNSMFVTVWIAIVELSTGNGMAANAGHEHPYLKRKDGNYELIKYRHGVALGALEGFKYEQHDFKMNRGDSIFVYTDGVTEATAAENVLYGNDRLTEALNKDPKVDSMTLLHNVKEDIDVFVGMEPQFDDLTMLSFTLL